MGHTSHSGVSRSATIACMWLMRRYQLSAKAALERLTRARSIVCPNPSFSAQLFLFEQMNHRLDIDHQLYRDFQFELARCTYLDYDTENKGIEGKNQLRQRFRQAFTLPYGHASCTVVERYGCRHCHQDLFTNADLSTHSKGSGLSDWFKKYGSYHSNNLSYDLEDCQQIFTHCLEWFLDQIDTAANAHDGAIQCPKCSTVLGKYGLNGSKCACGRWVAPAFRFDAEKIERHDVTKIKIETTVPSSWRCPCLRRVGDCWKRKKRHNRNARYQQNHFWSSQNKNWIYCKQIRKIWFKFRF